MVRRVDDHEELVVGPLVEDAIVDDAAARRAQQRVDRLADRRCALDGVGRQRADGASRPGPRRYASPMCETSNRPTASRTALCSLIVPGGIRHRHVP